MFNMTLAGHQGIGKTTTARILAKSIDADVLYVHCGDNSGVDMVRDRVAKFCQTESLESDGKIVILDEADSLTSAQASSAQSSLRTIIEENIDNTRFILTCNYLNRIIEPIQDRCTPIKLTYSIKDVLKRVLYILKNENIKFDKETLQEFTDQIIKPLYPSIRSIINNLEFWCIDGNLKQNGVSDCTGTNDVIEHIVTNIQAGNPLDARQYWIANEDKFNADYEKLASELFNAINDTYIQMIIAESLKSMPLVLDKEIQMYYIVLQACKNKK